jgi:SAM-dependent methyltransferase
MFSPVTSLEAGDASENLRKLFKADINTDRFQSAIQRLQNRFDIYTSTCPAPFIAPGLIVTPEIRRQCQIYLPIDEITSAFNLLYRSALNYPPILSSTPFHKALSWADAFAGLPSHVQFSANSALLLKKLLNDRDLLLEFLFESFLPRRFYGGFGRYPDQEQFIREWLGQRQKDSLRCLDAACGTGEDSYGLVNLLIECGFDAEGLRIEGWTIEPLEVWAAAHCSFPHDRQREVKFREKTARLFDTCCGSRISFRCADLTNPPSAEPFDLILCNGLLGGPIVNNLHELKRVVGGLSGLLAPGGILLAADSFHGGWKQQCPQQELRALLEMNGLKTFQAGEGVGGLKPD